MKPKKKWFGQTDKSCKVVHLRGAIREEGHSLSPLGHCAVNLSDYRGGPSSICYTVVVAGDSRGS